jgi:V/A-type H+-transporting ATPase subunit K
MEAILVLTILLVAVTITIGVYAVKKQLTNDKIMKILGVNMGTFVLLLVGATVFILSGNTSLASESVDGVMELGISNGEGLKFIGAALSTGMACIGTGIAVAAASSAAIGAISEDAKLLGKTIIFVGLSEGIAIYGLIISIMILG